MNFWGQIWDLIYPAAKICPLCGEKLGSGELICQKCGQTLKTWQRQDFCQKCGRPLLPPKGCGCAKQVVGYQKLWAAAPYSGNFKKAIHRLKYGNKTYLAPVLGRLMAEVLREKWAAPQALLVPVPLGPRKLAQRGFNQASLLAQAVGEATGFPVLEGVLRKVKDTVPQASLNKGARQRNLAGSFWAEGVTVLQEKPVILIDDIFTTGATLNAAARALLAAGAGEVYGLVWAMAVFPHPLEKHNHKYFDKHEKQEASFDKNLTFHSKIHRENP